MSDLWTGTGGQGGPPLADAPAPGLAGLPTGPPMPGHRPEPLGAGGGRGPGVQPGRDPFARRPSGEPDGTDKALVAVAIVLALALVVAVALLASRGGTSTATGPSTPPTTSASSTTTRPADPTDPTDPAQPVDPTDPNASTTVPPTTTPKATVPDSVIQAEVDALIPWIEQNRGLRFAEKPTVTVLPPAQFDELLLDKVDEDKALVERQTVMLQAMGFIPLGTDLLAVQKDLLAAGVAGFYDPDSKELVVEGVEIDEAARETLLHELVHALQDQTFDLARPEYDERKDEISFGLSAVAEGDARRMEALWEIGLPPDRRAQLEQENEDAADQAAAQMENVPPVLLQMLVAPYDLGEPLTTDIADNDGQAALDELFATPPDTSEQVMHGDKLDAREPRVEVTPPEPDPGFEMVDDGVFGELTTRLLIAPIVGQMSGERAATGWGGDWYVSWLGGDDGKTPCARVDWKTDTPTDLDELSKALQQWAERMPQATVENPTRDLVRVTSCMPSSAAGGESIL